MGADHLEALRNHEPTMPADMPINRASDNWRPLLSIADLAGGDWPARGRAAALVLSGVRVSEDEPVNLKLLADVQAVFRDRGAPEYLSSEDIIVTLKSLPESPWADWNKGRGITAAQLASRLRDFGTGPHGLRTRETRSGDKTGKRWHREDFIDAWSRYVTADPQHPQQTNESGANIQVALEAGYKERQARTRLTADSTVRAIACLAHSDIRKFYDAHGDLLPIHSLPDHLAACIQSIEVVKRNLTSGDGKQEFVYKIKLWNKPGPRRR